MTRRINRRSFLKQSSGAALGATAVRLLSPTPGGVPGKKAFRSAWSPHAERPWPGPEYWTNPLQDWRICDGRLECVGAGGDRNVFLLTHDVAAREGNLAMSVRLGQLEGGAQKLDQGFAGFRLGVKSFVDDYRARAVHGRGMNAGVTVDGQLFIGKVQSSAPRLNLNQELRLGLEARPSGNGYAIVLGADDVKGKRLGETERRVPGAWLEGGIALVCSS